MPSLSLWGKKNPTNLTARRTHEQRLKASLSFVGYYYNVFSGAKVLTYIC